MPDEEESAGCPCEDEIKSIDLKLVGINLLLEAILDVEGQIYDLLLSMFGGQISRSFSSVLIEELVSNEDRDDNSKIYGVDFLLVENVDVPIMLMNTRQMLQQNQKPIPTKEVTWEALFAWWNGTGPDPL
jgi:hypothetical protein